MAVVPMAVSKPDIHAAIQFLTVENVSGHEKHHRLCTGFKNPNIVMKSTVNHWVKSFKEGRMSTSNEACSGIYVKFGTDVGTIAMVLGSHNVEE